MIDLSIEGTDRAKLENLGQENMEVLCIILVIFSVSVKMFPKSENGCFISTDKETLLWAIHLTILAPSTLTSLFLLWDPQAQITEGSMLGMARGPRSCPGGPCTIAGD